MSSGAGLLQAHREASPTPSPCVLPPSRPPHTPAAGGRHYPPATPLACLFGVAGVGLEALHDVRRGAVELIRVERQLGGVLIQAVFKLQAGGRRHVGEG